MFNFFFFLELVGTWETSCVGNGARVIDLMWLWCRAWLGSFWMIHLDFEMNRIFQNFYCFCKRKNSCHILLLPSALPYFQSIPPAPRKNSFPIHWVTFAQRWRSWVLERSALTCSLPGSGVCVERPASLWRWLLREELSSRSCSLMSTLEMLLLLVFQPLCWRPGEQIRLQWTSSDLHLRFKEMVDEARVLPWTSWPKPDSEMQL